MTWTLLPQSLKLSLLSILPMCGRPTRFPAQTLTQLRVKRCPAWQAPGGSFINFFVEMEAQARHFRLSLDVQVFRTSRMLPQALAYVVVRVQLPVELTGKAFTVRPCICDMLAASTTLRAYFAHAGLQEAASTHQEVLLQTKPAHVVRGAETRLEDGHGSLKFEAGTMHLATLLAGEPQLQAQIHLQDSRCRAAPCQHLLPVPHIVGQS